MPNDLPNLEKLLLRFRAVLEERMGIQEIDVQRDPLPHSGYRVDLNLSIEVDGSRKQFLIEIKRHVYPRDVERIQVQLQRLSSASAGVDQVMVWAESVSEGARKLLEGAGIGYFDASGSLSIKLGHRELLIDRPPIKPNWKSVSSLFTPEREKVLHALLLGWTSWRTGTDLVAASGASPNTVSVLMRELERLDMVQSKGSGRSIQRQLHDPEQLLETWAQTWEIRKQAKARWFAFSQIPTALGELLATRMGNDPAQPWAFTGQYAANSWSPLLTAVSGYDLIVPPGSTQEIAQRLELKRADKGFNVTLHECSEFALQHRSQIEGRKGWFASPIVLYLELAEAGGRSRELAMAIKRNLIAKGENHG